MTDDAQLVAQAVGGSEEAYRQLLERYQRPVFSLVVRMVRDRALAEDVSQEVFLKAFSALASFDRKRKFSSWLFKIAHNATIDHLRRRRVETVPLEEPDDDRPDLLERLADEGGETPATHLDRRRLAEAIEEGIAGLRPEYREVLVLRFQQQLPYEEIAEVTGLPLGTVKTHIHRARKALAGALAEAGWTPETL